MKFLILFSIVFSTALVFAEDTVPVDVAQATVREASGKMEADGTGNKPNGACPFATTGCSGYDCESCGGCLTTKTSEENTSSTDSTR